MKTIIAPTDFSDVSLNAVNYAADLAEAITAELVVVNVVQLPIPVGDVPLTELEYEESTNGAEKKLPALAQQLHQRTKNKIKIQYKMAIGDLEHEVEEICGLHKPFAIVMATKASGTTESFFLGSYTISAINHFKYPVLVIPHKALFKGIKKIALTSAMEEFESEKTIEFLKEWLTLFKSKLDVVTIIDHGGDKLADSALVFLQNELSEFQSQFHLIEKKNVENGLFQFATKNNPDLFVIIHREYNGLNHLFHKSRSKPFILHSHIPVLGIPG